MTSKERLLLALNLEKTDRVPATIHQWQPYHLKNYMGGISDIEAFKQVGLDASITTLCWEEVLSSNWRINCKETQLEYYLLKEYVVETPEGILTYKEGTNPQTTFILEHLIKKDEDIYLLKKYKPLPKLNKSKILKKYDELGNNGIIREVLYGLQTGCWQDACCLCGTEEMILACYDKPEWVKEFFEILLEQKLNLVYDEMKGAKIDLVETGGGAASNTVISPGIHKEFCLPFDKKMHEAISDVGFKSVYHTCGGMTKIADLILENKCTASETLSPADVGGDIKNDDDANKIIDIFKGKIAMIGGLDQFKFLTYGNNEIIEKEVERLFGLYGKNGGYIMSASDHFFEAPKENLIAYAKASKQCLF